MAKLTCALLLLVLIATPFLNAMKAAAAGRSIPGGGGGTGGERDVDASSDKLYGGSKFFWWGLPWGLGLLHPWLFGPGHPWLYGPGPFWWLKDVKTTNPNYNYDAKASSAYNNGHGSASEVANFAPTSHSP